MILTSNRGFSEWDRFLETPWSRPLCLTAFCTMRPSYQIEGASYRLREACRSRAGKHPIEKASSNMRIPPTLKRRGRRRKTEALHQQDG